MQRKLKLRDKGFLTYFLPDLWIIRYHRMTEEEKRVYNQRRTEAFRRRRMEVLWQKFSRVIFILGRNAFGNADWSYQR